MKGRATEDKIKRRLQEFNRGPIQTFVADVLSVNEESFSCELDPADDAKLINVRLKAAIDETIKSGLVEIPKVGSSVLAGIINNNPDDCFVIKVMEVDKIIGYVSDQKFEMTSTSFSFNGGELGGLLKITELMQFFNKIKVFTQAIETVVNGAPVPTASSGSPDAFQTALKTALIGKPAPSVTQSEIEDTKIKH